MHIFIMNAATTPSNCICTNCLWNKASCVHTYVPTYMCTYTHNMYVRMYYNQTLKPSRLGIVVKIANEVSKIVHIPTAVHLHAHV